MSQGPSSRFGTSLMALLKRLVDNDDKTRREISQTICSLGHQWPEYVLLTCRHYLWQHVQLPDEEITVILNSMEMIVQENLSFIQHHVADSLIVMASLRATTLIETHRQSQEAACNLLVAIGIGFTQEVLDVILEDMKKGLPSHVNLIKTLIRLSSAHVDGMVPLLKSILEKMIPVLMNVMQDHHKSVFAAALGAFSKNILLDMDDAEKRLQTAVTTESFANEMIIAYNLLFNKWLEKTESNLEMENAKSTLVLCCGYLAINAPPALALSSMENHILPVVTDQLSQLEQGVKEESMDLTLRLSLIKTVSLIARAVQSSHQTFTLNFSRKQELLKYMQQLIEAEPTELLQTPIRLLAVKACLHLVQLNPPLNEADNSQLIKSCLRSIFSLVPVGQDQDGTSVNPGAGDSLYSETMAALHSLLKQILLHNLSPEGLQTIYKCVEMWITSSRDYERERAIDMTSMLLTFYWREIDVENIMAPIDLGAVLGQLLPRCVDPLLPIRQRAMDSLHILLKIQACCKGVNPEEQTEQEEILQGIGQRLVSKDTTVFYQGCSELAQLISEHLPRDQLTNLLFTLFTGLVDHQPSCSVTAAIIMKAVLKQRGSELGDQLSETLEALHLQMPAITQKEVRLAVLETFALLTSQHLPAVVRCLLRFPVDECTSAIWRSVAKKTELAFSSLEQLLQYLNRSVALNERSHLVREDESPDPLAVISALYEIVSEPEFAEVINTLYSDLFSALLIHISSSIFVDLLYDFLPCYELEESENRSPRPVCKSQELCLPSVKTLRAMLNRAHNQEMVNFFQEKGGCDLLWDPHTYPKGIALLARAMSLLNEHQLFEIVVEFAPVLSTTQECQKAIVVTFFTELLKCSVISHVQLNNILLNGLLTGLLHSTLAVRMLCLRGLGNIGVPGLMERHASDLLAAMSYILQSKEYQEVEFMSEVTSTLSKLLGQLSVNAVGPFCIEIAQRIRSFFEFKSIQVRAAAFTVFGTLAKCAHGHPRTRTSFMEEVHLNMVSLLLHLDEESEEVQRACLLTLCSVAPYIGSQEVCDIIQEHSREDSLTYEEFLNILSLQLIKDFPRRIKSYKKCCRSFLHMGPRFRGDANFLSAVLSQIPQEPAQRRTWIEKLCCFRIQCGQSNSTRQTHRSFSTCFRLC